MVDSICTGPTAQSYYYGGIYCDYLVTNNIPGVVGKNGIAGVSLGVVGGEVTGEVGLR